MFSIRDKSILLSGLFGATAIIAGGCSSTSSCPCFRERAPVVVKTPVPIAEQPAADEATELRGWHKSIAFYESGATQAWPTRWYYAPNPDYTTPENFVMDPMMFLAQTASLPVTMAKEPPFKQPVVYSGDVLPASYTAMPPYPPEQAVSPKIADPDVLGRPRGVVAPEPPPPRKELPPTYMPPPAPKPAKTVSHSAPTTMPAK
ncbi:MAG TPA: hypothetical protein VFE47_31125 [Tepidisphaeraceae bacterium]|jgi:hypothetical protein|nr:hypothetical protein [Tepidisphaeraceae bacterium]